jgi:maltooligosyltrehalose synthase
MLYIHTANGNAMHSDPPTGADVDNHPAAGEYQRMENRLTAVEHTLAAVQTDVAVIRSNYVTKEDLASVRLELKEQIAKSSDELHKAINEQTWRLVTWVTTAMALYSGAIYFIARHVD